MAVLGGDGMVGRVMLVLAAAIEITRSGAYARPNEGSGSHATLGYGGDGCAAQCTDAGAAKCALLGRRHVGTTAETNGGSHCNDWKSMSHGSTSASAAMAH